MDFPVPEGPQMLIKFPGSMHQLASLSTRVGLPEPPSTMVTLTPTLTASELTFKAFTSLTDDFSVGQFDSSMCAGGEPFAVRYNNDGNAFIRAG